MQTVSEANSKDHWAVKNRRHKRQQFWVKLYFKKCKEPIELPCLVKLTRIGKRRMDSDNLQMALKWVRDAVADCIIPGKKAGRADDSPQIRWKYDQEIGKEYAVLVEIFYPRLGEIFI